METSEPDITTQDGSKEAAAIAALSSTLVAPHKPRRVRRRRRTLRRRLADSLLPFVVLVGLTVFAAGVVSVVEIGAAANSKVKSTYNGEITSYEEVPSIDFESAQRGHQDLMRRHAELKSRKSGRASQIAYQMELTNDAIRELSGLDDAIASPAPRGTDDIMDWDLFEAGGGDPRSTLQRTGAKTRSTAN